MMCAGPRAITPSASADGCSAFRKTRAVQCRTSRARPRIRHCWLSCRILPQPFNANVVVTPVGYRQWAGAFYAQDEMKLKPNFTLRLGLRDEMTNGWNEVNGRCANLVFDPSGLPLTDPLVGHSCLTENNAKALLQPACRHRMGSNRHGKLGGPCG